MFTRGLSHYTYNLHHFSASRFSTKTPLSTCIVGSGPSGFYTAKYLLKKVPDIRISIIDELPTPFGLVRYGVAPDHADTKNVIHDFTDNVLSDDRVSYFGNVKVHKNISLRELQSMYDAVVLSYGASSDRKLNIKGEDLNGVYASRQFVNWYNGHPYFVNAITDDDFERNQSGNVVIIGQGNVAIDCARILASNLDTLQQTDITQHAVDKLKRFGDRIKNIYLIGRRGAVQSSFTNKELREVISDMKDDCIATVNREEMEESTASDASKKEMEDGGRAVKRKMSIFERATFDDDDAVTSLTNSTKKCVHFRFLLSPLELVGDDKGRVQKVILERNTMTGDAGSQKAVGTGETLEIDAGLVLTSIGYQAQSIEEIVDHWNGQKHTVNHDGGRVNDDGLYCAGWLKRGPSGIIGTNIPDAQQTVKSIVEDWEALKFTENGKDSLRANDDLRSRLEEKGVPFVDKEGWNRIDRYELEMGESKGKTREKMLAIEDMVKVANGK